MRALMVPPGVVPKMVRPGTVTPVVPPRMGISMVRPGLGILLGRELATRGGHVRCRGGLRTLASMGMVRADGHIDGGPRSHHHIGTVQAHYPVRDICLGEKHGRR